MVAKSSWDPLTSEISQVFVISIQRCRLKKVDAKTMQTMFNQDVLTSPSEIQHVYYKALDYTALLLYSIHVRSSSMGHGFFMSNPYYNESN